MSKLYVAEFPPVVSGALPQQPALTDYVVDYSGGHAESAAFNGATGMIEVHTDAVCSILIGKAPTATTSHMRMASGETRRYAVEPGDKISAVSNS
jgi:hypothetical protein